MKRYTKFLGLLLFTMLGGQVSAQISPLDAQFFQNRYIANPAMAGFENGTRAALIYRSQWGAVPGSPTLQNIMIDTRSKKVGLGLNVYNEKAGDLRNTKVSATYAFHSALSTEGNQIHFGLSLVAQKGNYDIQGIIGSDPNDPNLLNYNDKKVKADVDLGLAYTSKRFSLEGAFYDFRRQISNDTEDKADYRLFYAATSYSFPIHSGNLNTKFAYRGIKNYTDIMDMGFEYRTGNKEFGFTALYHTSKSTTLGMSYLHKNKWEITGLFNTVNPVNNYSNGTFELALKVNLSKAN